jgi:phenylacetic acid degradation operon negative regulatory protein
MDDAPVQGFPPRHGAICVPQWSVNRQEGRVAKLEPPHIAGLVAQIAAAMPLRATGFIVTLYGDAVVPRGGEVWMGTIIEACALVGISETLVRTAVSRLVTAGQLEGQRQGRRSFYRLTDSARAEFDEAARVIYGPPDPAGWRFVYLPEDGAEARITQLERQGYARLRPQVAVGPARGPAPSDALVFEAGAGGAVALLPDFAAQHWDLTPHAQAYTDLLTRFAPVQRHVPNLTGSQALALRLLLVHAWRSALLRDPRLPLDALPQDWPGHRARTLFAELYQALSPEAESHISTGFEGVLGVLTGASADMEKRLDGLHRWADPEAVP